MGKTLRREKDPYSCVRREMPPVGHPIVHKKDFVRKWEKISAEREILEGVEEYFGGKQWQKY